MKSSPVLECLENRTLLTGVYDFDAPTFSNGEGDGTNTSNVVMLSRDTAADAENVDVILAGNTAVAGTDFTAGPVTISFAMGEFTKAVPIEILGEEIVELDETIDLLLTNFTNGGSAGVTNPTSQFTITNDDAATLSIDDVTQAETDAGTTAFTFTVTLDTEVDTGVSFDFATADGVTNPATTADSDYTGISTTTRNFASTAAGATESITVTVNGDTAIEFNETFFLNLSSIAAGGRDVTFSDNQGLGTINTDDVAVDAMIDGGGNLLLDESGQDTIDALTISTDGTDVIITDASNPLGTGGIPGATGDGTMTITIPLASFAGGIIINSMGNDDSLTVDFGGGANFGRTIDFNGGSTMQASGDDLFLQGGGTFADLTLGFTNLTDGTIDVTGNSTITYTGLEPISSTITATNVTLNYSTAAETITVTDAGGGQTTVDSTLGEIVTFNNPTSMLTINAGDTGGDIVTLESIDPAFAANILIDGEGGADTINIEVVPAGITTTVNGGNNTDTINLGSAANSLGGVLGGVNINGDGHDAGTVDLTIKTDTNTLDTGDILNLNDQGDAGAFTYALDATTFARTGTGTITYGTVETLNLNTSLGAADVDVTTSADGVNTNITTQDAADDIDVATTGLDSNVIINTAGGADDIDIVTTGVDGPDGDALGSFMQVNADDDGDTLTLEDSGAASRVELNGQAGVDTVNIWASGSLSVTVVNGGDNTDTFNIGSAANSLAGILGNICIAGDGHDAGTIDLTIKTDTNTLDTGDILNLNDQGDAGAFTYALDATTFARTGIGTIDYASVETLNLNTSIGAADVDVTNTAGGISTNITTQDAADDIDVATTGLDSNVIINTAGGEDNVEIATTGGDGPDGDALGSFTQVNSGAENDTLTLTDTGAASRVELNTQERFDTINIDATGTLSVTNINAGDNNDIVNLGNSTFSLSGILGDICFNGDANGTATVTRSIKGDSSTVSTSDTITLNDSGSFGSFTYSLSDSTFTRTGIGTITFATAEWVHLLTATGLSDVDITNTIAGGYTTVQTRAGSDIDITTTGVDSIVTIDTFLGADDDINIVATGGDGPDGDALGSFLLINGRDGNDTITLRDSGAASRVELDGEMGADTLNIEATGTLSVTNVLAGSNSDVSSDTVNVGSVSNSLGGILGDICIEGDGHGAGTVGLTIKSDTNSLDTGDVVNLNDQGDAGSFTYALDATTFARTGTGTITYGTIETLNLNTSLGAADVDVTTTAAAVNTNITTQDAADDIDVATTGADSNVIINSAAGGDSIDIVTTGGDGADGDALGSFTQVNSGDDGDALTLEDSGAASRVELNSQAGADTIDVWATGALSVTDINTGDSSDTINIGTPANSISGILGDVCVNGDAHDAGTFSESITAKATTVMVTLDTGDILNVNDQGDAGSFTYALDATTFARTGTGTITYATIETLLLNTSIGAADVDVTDTASIITSIRTQTAADDIDVRLSGAGSILGIDAGAGADAVDVAATGAGSVTFVDGGDDSDALTLDSGRAGSGVELNGDAGNDTTNVNGTGTGVVTVVDGGDDVDTINIQATASLSFTDVFGGMGSDAINISSDAPVGAGDLDGILGAICIFGDAHDAGLPMVESVSAKALTVMLSIDTGDSLNISDEGSAATNAYTLDDTTFQRTGAVATGLITYATIETLNIETGGGNDDIDIVDNADGTTTSIDAGAGDDDIDVTLTGDGSILRIDANSGMDTIDIASTGAGSVALIGGGADDDTITLVTSGMSAGVGIDGGTGLDTINIEGQGAASATSIDGDDDVDTINIRATAAGTGTDVFGGAGNDVVNIGTIGNSLSTILGDLCVFGDAHDAAPTTDLTIKTDTNSLASGDIINFNDQGDAGSYAYTVTDTTVTRTGIAVVTYGTVETVNLNAAIGSSNVTVVDTGDGINTNIVTQDMLDVINVVTTGLDSNVTIGTGAGADAITITNTGGDGPDGDMLGSFLVVNGGDNGDAIILLANGLDSRVLLDGEGGDDRYFITVGTLGGPVCIDDQIGEGLDEVRITGTAGADVFVIDDTMSVANGDQTVTYGVDTDLLSIDGDDGADDFTVSPSQAALIDILGGDPTMAPGDTLEFVSPMGETASFTPFGPNSGEFSTTGGFQDVTFDEIEALSFSGDMLTVNSGDEDDLFDLTLTGMDAGTLDLTTDVDGMPGPGVMVTIMFTGVEQLTANGEGGDDLLRQNNTGGPMGLTNGIIFNGGMGSDTLEVLMGMATTVTHNFANQTDGDIDIDAFTLTYTGLEPILDTITATDRIFAFAGMDDDITLSDLGGGMSRVESVSSSETVDFTNPTGSLTINAGDGNDTVDASTSAQGVTLNGEMGDDSILGSAMGDNILGAGGRDTLNGADGDDSLLGGGASGDQLTGGLGNDVMNGGAGTDLIRESADGDFDLNPSQLIGTVTGTDTLIDIEKAWLEGGASNNNINAEDFPGSVTLSGFSGSDTLVGGPEIDILYGEDSLNSGGAADTIMGNGGADLIYGQDGDDSVDGGDGNDMIRGASGRDILNGDAGDDQIFGQGASGDQLRGGAGNDTLDGGAGNDIVTETADTDFDLDGMGGNGTLDGGAVTGVDTLISTEFARLTGGASGNSIDASGWDNFATLNGAGGDDMITGAEGGSIINGDDGADMLQGGSVADTIAGGTGNDSAHGGDGADSINGNDDDDQLDGGLGNDTIDGDAGNDRIVGGSNTDQTPDMPVDATTLNDTDEDSLLGGTGDDTIKGGLGSDIADGEAGADVIDMGSGGDTTDGIDSVVGGDMADLIFIDPEDLLI